MAIQNRVYVARKSCGCIVAAFPVLMDKAVKGELLKQLAKAGYDIEQAGDYDVRADFRLACDCNKPPLLKAIDEATSYHRVGADYRPTENAVIEKDDGVDMADVDAAGEDMTPEAEEAEAAIEAEEARAEEPINHQTEADNLLNDFLSKKDEDEEDEDSE